MLANTTNKLADFDSLVAFIKESEIKTNKQGASVFDSQGNALDVQLTSSGDQILVTNAGFSQGHLLSKCDNFPVILFQQDLVADFN